MRSATPELPQGLGGSSGVLGRYIHDHPREWYPVRFDRKLPALVDPLYLARTAPEVSPPLMAAQCTIGLAPGRDRLRTFYGGATDMAGVQTFGTMVPSPDHGINIVGGNEQASTASRLHIDLVYDDAVVRNIEESRTRLRDAFAAAGSPCGARPVPRLSTWVVGAHIWHGADAPQGRIRRGRRVEPPVRRPQRDRRQLRLLHDRRGEESGSDGYGDLRPRRRSPCSGFDLRTLASRLLIPEARPSRASDNSQRSPGDPRVQRPPSTALPGSRLLAVPDGEYHRVIIQFAALADQPDPPEPKEDEDRKQPQPMRVAVDIALERIEDKKKHKNDDRCRPRRKAETKHEWRVGCDVASARNMCLTLGCGALDLRVALGDRERSKQSHREHKQPWRGKDLRSGDPDHDAKREESRKNRHIDDGQAPEVNGICER